MIPIFQFAIISVLLTAATISDIRTREVSDIFSVGILLTAFLNFNIENLIGLVIPSLCLVIAVMCGGFGGADVKIIAALSVVIGLEGSVLLVLIALISMLLFYAKSPRQKAILLFRSFLSGTFVPKSYYSERKTHEITEKQNRPRRCLHCAVAYYLLRDYAAVQCGKGEHHRDSPHEKGRQNRAGNYRKGR